MCVVIFSKNKCKKGATQKYPKMDLEIGELEVGISVKQSPHYKKEEESKRVKQLPK
jgi:hypothetical protein